MVKTIYIHVFIEATLIHKNSAICLLKLDQGGMTLLWAFQTWVIQVAYELHKLL